MACTTDDGPNATSAGGHARNHRCDLREHRTGSVIAWVRRLVGITQQYSDYNLRLCEQVR